MLYISIPKEYVKHYKNNAISELTSSEPTRVETRTYDEVLEKYDVFLGLLSEVDDQLSNLTTVMNCNVDDPYYPELMQSCDKMYKSLIEKRTVYDNVCKVLAWMLKIE